MALEFGEAEEIAIELIIRDPSLQPRAEVSEEAVDRYALYMQEGDEFPPVLLVKIAEADAYEVADGNTTIEAALKIGRDSVRARVAVGVEGDALEYGHTLANQKHGQPLTKADRRKRFDWLESLPRYKAMSAKQLAPIIGVDRRTIGRWRKGEGAAHCAPPRSREEGLKIWDGEGRDIRPAWIAEIAEPYRQAIAYLEQALEIAEELASDPMNGGHMRFKITRIRQDLEKAIEAIRSTEPAAVCPDCGGSRCGSCLDTGFLSRDAVDKRAAG